MTFLFAPRLRFTLKTIAASAIITCASGQIGAQTAVDTRTGSVRPSEPVTLNFANAEIEAVSSKIVAQVAKATGATLRG